MVICHRCGIWTLAPHRTWPSVPRGFTEWWSRNSRSGTWVTHSWILPITLHHILRVLLTTHHHWLWAFSDPKSLFWKWLVTTEPHGLKRSKFPCGDCLCRYLTLWSWTKNQGWRKVGLWFSHQMCPCISNLSSLVFQELHTLSVCFCQELLKKHFTDLKSRFLFIPCD